MIEYFFRAHYYTFNQVTDPMPITPEISACLVSIGSYNDSARRKFSFATKLCQATNPDDFAVLIEKRLNNHLACEKFPSLGVIILKMLTDYEYTKFNKAGEKRKPITSRIAFSKVN